ncbi:signal peptidase I [Microbacterium paraoxydans]|uniref:signal peptidase I n=1 Tax=Microbacterium paraoxydans TaxID=199592 RepID=UPI003D74D5A3
MTALTRREARARGQAQPRTEPGDRGPSRRPGAVRALGDALLWLAAAAGVVCIVLVLLAATAQITLILFRTGSMSPTIPAGSVAVVQRVPASAVEVGDVVTVDRPGDLPVTHRVTSVQQGSTAEERVLTLRGDANAADDPFPYAVTSVRTVLFAVPGLATVIVALGHPVVLGGLTVAATALVVWAFWPRSPRRARSEGGPP